MHFAAASRYCMVSLEWVKAVTGDTVVVDGTDPTRLRSKRKPLMQALAGTTEGEESIMLHFDIRFGFFMIELLGNGAVLAPLRLAQELASAGVASCRGAGLPFDIGYAAATGRIHGL
ncbi:MAG: hypothetical protein ACLT4Y_12545 [Bifidobacterium breve]